MKAMLLIFVLALTSIGMRANQSISVDSLEKRIKALEMEIKLLKVDPAVNCQGNQFKSDNDEIHFQGNPMRHEKIIMNREIMREHGLELKSLTFTNKLFVLSPLFVLFFVMIILCIFLKRNGFSLREALASKHSDVGGQVVIYPSSSKFLAFISIIAGIIFATFIITFYFYFAYKHAPLPNFLGLWPVVALIGIGVLPYIFQSMFKK
jgi:hypothetical protein